MKQLKSIHLLLHTAPENKQILNYSPIIMPSTYNTYDTSAPRLNIFQLSPY